MPYVDLAGLSRFASRQKDQIGRERALLRDMQWLMTDKAGAVSLWPAPSTPLKPAVDFLFTETPPASGDKSPSNPSTITGVSSVNVGRVGKNLLLKVSSAQTVSSVTMTPQTDGSYILNGSNSSAMNMRITDCSATFGTPTYSSVILNTSKRYTLSARVLEGTFSGDLNIALGYLDGSGQYEYQTIVNGAASRVFDSTYFPDGRFVARVRAPANSSFSNVKVVFQLEEGDTATDFEAPMLPADANHALPLGSTYYGGTVDLATGVMTVTWEKLAVTGGEAWQSLGEQATGIYSYALIRGFNSDGGATGNGDTCSHFVYNNGASEKIVSWHHSKKYIYVYSSISTLSDFKAWLASQVAAGTPVEFCFQSNEAAIVQLSPTEILSLTQTDKYTPRLNTVYTDAQAVQVGYIKSPIREEYELQQAVVAQGGGV